MHRYWQCTFKFHNIYLSYRNLDIAGNCYPTLASLDWVLIVKVYNSIAGWCKFCYFNWGKQKEYMLHFFLRVMRHFSFCNKGSAVPAASKFRTAPVQLCLIACDHDYSQTPSVPVLKFSLFLTLNGVSLLFCKNKKDIIVNKAAYVHIILHAEF